MIIDGLTEAEVNQPGSGRASFSDREEARRIRRMGRGVKMETQQPLQGGFSAGQVSCALFENAIQVNGESRQIIKATLGRVTRPLRQLKTSQSFSRNEIPLAIHVLQKSFEAMLEKSPEDEINQAIDEERVG